MLVTELDQEYDVLVIGGGIAGIEASVTLADMGFKVLLVEKKASVGGTMALLSKVFPTLDCASCISTPKMASVQNHPNISLLVYSEIKEIYKESEANFRVRIHKRATYVDPVKCTACTLCEKACPVIVLDEFQFGLRGRKAAYIPFDIAVPKKAVIDINNCIYCGMCERVCPADAINFLDQPKDFEVKVKAVIVATGFELFDPLEKPEFKYRKFKNVITAMQMDRILAPTSPYGTVVRPYDLKEPERIAFVLCVGSRDLKINYPLCSQICCMYSIKQAQLILGALPLAEATIFYIDIRAFGKGFEEFYQQAKTMGVRFVKGQVDLIDEKEDGTVIVRYYDFEEGQIKEEEFDLVVLAVGVRPPKGIVDLFKNTKPKTDIFGWFQIADPQFVAADSGIPGIFIAGAASGPKDIPDTIIDASAAAMQAARYIRLYGGRD